VRQRRDERGTGVIGTLVGVLIFMTLLLVAVQVLVRLYATSMVTSAAFGAAEDVATAASGPAAVPGAQAAALSQLGSWGAAHTTFTWLEVDGERVVLEVRAQPPGFVHLLGTGAIERTITVRTERFR
jgi:hypothetical protein